MIDDDDDFGKYFIAKKRFEFQQAKEGTWIYLGILLQMLIIVAGILMLPIDWIGIWMLISIGSVMVSLTSIIKLIIRENQYSTYSKWKELQDRLSQD